MVDRKLAVLVFHVQELSIVKEQGNRSGEGNAYNNLGNAYYNLGDFQQAIECYTQSLSIVKEIGYKEWKGYVSYNLANAYYLLGDFLKAIEYYTRSLSFAKGVGNRNLQTMANVNLGVAYFNVGEFKQAIECHKQDLSIAEKQGDRVGEGRAYGNLGVAHCKLGNFKQAIEYHKEQLNIAKEVGDRASEGETCGNLGIAYRGMGSYKQAIEYFKRDLSIAKELGDRVGEGQTYCNLGNAYDDLGKFEEAIENHKQDLSIAKEIGDRAGEGGIYGNLGCAYASLGNFKQALMYHKQQLSIAKELGDRVGEGTAYGNLGVDYFVLRNLKQATEYSKQSLSFAKEAGSRVEEGKAYGRLGVVYQELGDFEQAIEYHKQYLSIAKEIGDRAGEGTAQRYLGDAYYRLGNSKLAIEYHKQNLSISKEVGSEVKEGDVYCALGLDYESSASFSEAIDCYQSSIRLLEKSRALLQSEDAWKINFSDLHRYAYTGLWRILLRNGDTDEALCAAEQGRAKALMDILERQYGVDPLSPASNGPKETVSYMLNNLSTPIVFLALDRGVIISFWVLRKGKEIVSRLFEIKHGDAALLIENTLKEIGAGVCVKCENRSMDEISDGPQSTREAVEEIEESSTSSVNSLRPLYDVIIGPIVDLLQGGQLIVVPDGPFCLAPYSALSETIRIRTVPSLTTLKLITGSPDDFHSKSGVLLVGDPCLDEVTFRYDEPILEQLPFARKEVEEIGKLLKITPLTGRDATKDEVLKRLTSVSLVHIAAHGCAQSGEIVLAPNPGRTSQIPKKQDYILTMSDVQAVCLRARLVVLSCCHSGQGEVKSEGVVGIARSFLSAGARSVLVSLWAIDDEATMVFMVSFYQHLADGKSASVALHQAMKSLRESEEFSAVKYWAPFVLIGDDVKLEFGEKK